MSTQNNKRYGENQVFGLQITTDTHTERQPTETGTSRTFSTVCGYLRGPSPQDTTEGSSKFLKTAASAAQQMRCQDDNTRRTVNPRALRYRARASGVLRKSSPFVAQQRREQKRYGRRADVTTEELLLCNGTAAFVSGFTNLEDRVWYLLGNVVLKCQHACHAFLVLVISYSYKPPERQEYFQLFISLRQLIS